MYQNNDSLTFFDHSLWSVKDHLTENYLGLSFFYYQNDRGNLSPLKLKVCVYNFNKKINNQDYLDHKDVLDYLNIAKAYLFQLQDKLSKDQNFSDTFSFTMNLKTKIKTVIARKAEYENKYFVGIIFSDKETNQIDSERVYISVANYYSFIDILEQFKNNYLVCVDSVLNRMSLLDVVNNVNIISEKLTNYTSQTYGRLTSLENKQDNVVVVDPSDQDSIQKLTETFINQNSDKMDIGLVPQIEPTPRNPPPQIKSIDEDEFTVKVLDNDVKTLEEIVLGCNSEDIPLLKVLNVIANRLELSESDIVEKFFPGHDKKDLYLLLYLNTRYIKHIIHQHLELKNPVPASVMPMYITCKNTDKFNVSLMYDLLVYFTFYTHLKGQLQITEQVSTRNKSLMCFSIKAVLSPLVFCFLDKASTKDVIVSEVVNRYKKYRDNKVFDSIVSSIKHQYAKDIDVSEESIKSTISSVCDIALSNISSFEVKNVVKKFSFQKVPSELILEVNNLKTLTKVLAIESLYFTSIGKVDKTTLKEQKGIESLEDVPQSILKIFNLVEEKETKTTTNEENFANAIKLSEKLV